MKKILLSSAVILTFSTFLNAEVIKTYGIYLTGGVADLGDVGVDGGKNVDASTYGIGYAAQRQWESGFTIGMGMDFNLVNLNDDIRDSDTSTGTFSSLYGVDVDLKAGYTLKKFTIFGLASFCGEETSNWATMGFGYGAELQYEIIKKITIGANYKILKMDPSFGDNYDYTMTKGFLRYNF